jgi:prevent-host-death family protein
MDVIGAFEAKTHFSALLERVSSGEHITITKHGMPVAKIVPVDGRDRQAVRTAINRLKKFAAKGKPLGIPLRTLREEGRR